MRALRVHGLRVLVLAAATASASCTLLLGQFEEAGSGGSTSSTSSTSSSSGVPATCENGALDTGETDIDCGGSLCPKCTWGRACVVDGDCVNGFCGTVSGVTGEVCDSKVLSTSGHVQPSALALDDDNVYWVDTGEAHGTGEVHQVPKAGGETLTLATAQDYPVDIAVGAGSVYWVNRGDDTMASTPIGGGSVTTMAGSLSSPMAIALDDVFAYVVGFDLMGRVPLAGGALETLSTLPGDPIDMVVDTTDVYCTSEDKVLRMSHESEATFATGLSPRAMAIDGTHVYWTDSGLEQVLRAPLGGGEPVSLAALTSAQSIAPEAGMAVSDTHVYFAVMTSGDVRMSLMKVPISGSGSTPTLIAQNSTIRGIVVDSEYVYWAVSSTIRKALR